MWWWSRLAPPCLFNPLVSSPFCIMELAHSGASPSFPPPTNTYFSLFYNCFFRRISAPNEECSHDEMTMSNVELIPVSPSDYANRLPLLWVPTREPYSSCPLGPCSSSHFFGMELVGESKKEKATWLMDDGFLGGILVRKRTTISMRSGEGTGLNG